MNDVVKKTGVGGIFKREQRSLFGEILDWMLTPLLLLWPASLALTWLVAKKPIDSEPIQPPTKCTPITSSESS